MARIKPTRMELIKLKKRIKLANKGHKLLKQKRDVLIMEFFNVLSDVKDLRLELGGKLSAAQNNLYNAISLEGETEINRHAFGLVLSNNYNITETKIMGVTIPKIGELQTKYDWPGTMDTSIPFESAVINYRNLFPKIIELAEKQLALTKIAHEVRNTKRRVNSLEYFTIPRFKKDKKKIEFRLGELERENFVRLKVMKRIKVEY